MKILIIGSKGFIGSHCVKYFKAKNHDVLEADVFSIEKQNYTCLEKENTNFEQLFINDKYDICINASGSANVAFSFQNPYIDFNLNVANVSKILDAIYKHNKECKFINFSSAAVYGNPEYLPIDENHPLKPISPYGLHKLQSEKLLYEYSKFFGLKTISLRIFSAYGEGLKKQLFWDLYQKSLKNNTIELFGTGSETRDFIYIKDLVKAIDLVINNADFVGDTINIANGLETSIKEVSHIFSELFNSKIKINFTGSYKKGDPTNWKSDISKLKSFGYSQKYTLTEGLKNYVKWLKELK
ncbi:MAG: SDR family oxidoreductase [Bacteroidales bacterium]|nr:SDR family oxidoreductase [Bacteroidales bacterium]